MAAISGYPLNCVPLFLSEGLFMKKSLLLGAVALASLGLAGCGEKAVDDAANAEVALNDTMNAADNEMLEAAPALANDAADAANETTDAAADAADAAKDAAEAAAAAAANKM
jgi:hypothetical protein